MTTEVAAIDFDAAQDDSPEAIAELFLSQTDDAEEPSDTEGEEELEADSDAEEADSDEDAEEPSEEEEDDGDSEQSEETTETKPATPKRAADEDTVVVKVGDEEREVPVKDLKRLFGQEQALNRKNVEVAEAKRKAEEALGAHTASLNRHYEMAREAYKPFENINFVSLAASGEYTPAQIESAMEAERHARANLEYFHGELTTLGQQQTKARGDRLASEAQAAFRELSDPQTGIPGFSPDVLRSVFSYATNDLGIDQSIINELTNASVIRALHKVYSAERGTKVLETKTKPVAKKGPEKVLKSAPAPVKGVSNPDVSKKAMARFKASGDIDDAVAAILARGN